MHTTNYRPLSPMPEHHIAPLGANEPQEIAGADLPARKPRNKAKQLVRSISKTMSKISSAVGRRTPKHTAAIAEERNAMTRPDSDTSSSHAERKSHRSSGDIARADDPAADVRLATKKEMKAAEKKEKQEKRFEEVLQSDMQRMNKTRSEVLDLRKERTAALMGNLDEIYGTRRTKNSDS